MDNNVIKTRQNRLIITPAIWATNDMSNALYNNNNAKSKSVAVFCQNGVADFAGALHHNNGAYSKTGDVFRQNGIIGGDAFPLSQEAIQAIFETI